MKTIIISPFSRFMRNGQLNPKNYPYWKELVGMLKEKGYYVIQVGIDGEAVIGADEFVKNPSLKTLKKMINECFIWFSVDNFFQHLAYLLNKKGIVIFGQSDPIIFGHNTNINMLKDRRFLKPLQFDIWERSIFSEDIFPKPEEVMEYFNKMEGEK